MNKLLSIGLLITFLIMSCSFTTKKNPQRLYTKTDSLSKIDQLRNKFGVNKQFIPELELAALVSLNHFPELKETSIEFKFKNIKTTMATRPTVSSLFGKKSKRTYVIYVDEKIKDNNGVLTNEVPFNALVGLIGHEYQHIVEYEGKSALQIANLGIKYCNKKFKKKFECETDHAIIDRGLGWQLRDWAAHAMVHSSASDKYKAYKKENYLSPDEISNLILKDKSYMHTLNRKVYEEMVAVD